MWLCVSSRVVFLFFFTFPVPSGFCFRVCACEDWRVFVSHHDHSYVPIDFVQEIQIVKEYLDRDHEADVDFPFPFPFLFFVSIPLPIFLSHEDLATANAAAIRAETVPIT